MKKSTKVLNTIFFVTMLAGCTYNIPFNNTEEVTYSEEQNNKKHETTNEQGSSNIKTEEHNEPSKPITVAFTGDILLDRSVGENIKKYGVDYPFREVSDTLKEADITAGNLETSVSTRGTAADKQFTFRSKPETLQGLVNSGYDMVSLANNHTLDYGQDALFDTIDNLKKYGIGYSGAGSNEKEAFTAYYKEVNGKTIGIIGISRVLPTADWFARGDSPGLAHGYQTEPMLSYIKETVSKSDYTIVMIHWNKERTDYPEEYARVMARTFVDAGVDAIIGSHSHSLQGIEFVNDVPVYYSLGNFVFTDSSSPKGHETMIVYVTFNDSDITTKVLPAKIVNGQPKLMGEEYNSNIWNKLSTLSFNAKVQKDGTVKNTEKH